MLAGCQLSVSFTRGLLWQLVADLSVIDPEYPCSSHVDDLSQVFVAERKKDLEKKLLEAGRRVGSEVKRVKLTLSSKSTLIPENAFTIRLAMILPEDRIHLTTTITNHYL